MDSGFVARLGTGAPMVLDGGLATSLEARGYDLSGPLWSARLLSDDPQAVVDVHDAFVDAGAEVVTTASYQLSRLSLALAGHDPRDEPDLITRSVELVRRAAERSGTRVFVAASIGTYGASLADGSEYRGHYRRSVDELVAFHAPRVEAAVAAGADVLACETIPSGAEVAAVAHLLAGLNVPAWISMTVGGDGTVTPEGVPFEQALAPALEVDEVVAVGVNCCVPELATAALRRLAKLDHPLVVYPNLGRRWADGHWVGPATPADPSPWLEAGARLVGGCCGSSPDDIRAVAAALRSA